MKHVGCISIMTLMLLIPGRALPCGGFFCQQTVVDQNAERILFEVNGDDTITAHVEISYTGAPEGFSWVVPVPDTPVLDVVPAQTLRILDRATAPRFIPPPTTCEQDFSLFGGGAGANARENAGGVWVEELPRVGPFEPTVISSQNPTEIEQWLETNGYLLTEEMKPFIADYVAMGMKFLAMKLAPDASTSDIAPIKMTYPSIHPMVPLVLTAVAAEPEMGIIVMIAGSQRYEASNVKNMQVPTDLVRLNPADGMNNYFALVSWLVDQEGGEAQITELAAPTQSLRQPVENVIAQPSADDARQYALNVLDRHAYLTRFYTRISGWEVLTDPGFQPSMGSDVSNVHDLSGRKPMDVCDDATFIPCGDTYCGVGSKCSQTTMGLDGCLCDEGKVARSITSASGRSRAEVTCMEAGFDLMQSVAALGMNDPCEGYSCGRGACVALNGTATCSCDSGYAAVSLGNDVTCAQAIGPAYQPDQLLWPDSGCSCRAADPRQTIAWALALSLWWMGRMRRRRAG